MHNLLCLYTGRNGFIVLRANVKLQNFLVENVISASSKISK